VLQLLLGFRVLDLLAAFVIYIGVHVCRLVQLQQQLSAGVFWVRGTGWVACMLGGSAALSTVNSDVQQWLS
jgi:hypothetical protein